MQRHYFRHLVINLSPQYRVRKKEFVWSRSMLSKILNSLIRKRQLGEIHLNTPDSREHLHLGGTENKHTILIAF